MPWRERSPMDERVQFISDYQRQLFTIDGYTKSKLAVLFVDRCGKNSSDKSAKEVDRQFAPDSVIVATVEKTLRYQLQQGIRSGQI